MYMLHNNVLIITIGLHVNVLKFSETMHVLISSDLVRTIGTQFLIYLKHILIGSFNLFN